MSRRIGALARLAWVKGWRRTASALGGSVFGYQRWYVFWTSLEPLAGTSAQATGGSALTCRLATFADVDALGVFASHRRPREFRHWLESGHRLFLALDDTGPVAYHCMTLGPPVTPPLSRIRLAAAQVWFEDMYVLPGQRRRHISTQLRRYRQRCLREWGYEETVSGVHERNVPALRLVHAYNPGRLRRVERHTCLTVLGMSRVWVEQDALPILERYLERAAALGPGHGHPSPRCPDGS